MGDIFIYHGIGTEKNEVSADNVISQLKSAAESDVITIHFHTPGGDVYEGFRMYNALQNFKANTGKKLVGMVEGVCASIGTLVLGACDEIIMNTVSQLMIHNPHTETKGDANKLRGVADQLDKIKHLLIDVYKKKTGLSEDKLWELYDNETWLNAQEARKMGFVDDVQDAIKAVATININNFMEAKSQGLWNKIQNLFSLTKFKNEFTETLADGRVIIVMSDDENWTGKQVVLEDGSPLENGNHALASGKTIMVMDGVITEVMMAEPEDKKDDEMENKIKELEAQLAAANAEKEQALAQVTNLQKETATAKADHLKIKNRLETIEKDFLILKEETSKTIGTPPKDNKGPVIKNVDPNPQADPMGDFAMNFYKNRHLIKNED